MKKKKLSLYKKSLIIYIICLTLISAIFLGYVYNSLVFYDKNELDNYMNEYIKNIKENLSKGEISEYSLTSSLTGNYEKNASVSDAYKSFIKDKEITYKETKNENVYDILAGDDVLFTVTLDGSNTTTRLSLLTITEWKIKDVKNYLTDGLYSYDIYVPSTYKVLINDVEVSESDLVEGVKLEGFEDAYDYTNLLTNNHYEIKGLINEPTIKIYNSNNEEVTPEIEGTTYKYTEEKTYESKEEASNLLGDFDPLKVAETWSLFLTNDVSFNQINTYLIKGTKMYTQAYEWSTGRDRTFTAAHEVCSNAFTDEYEKNFVFYSSDVFKVEVSLNKHLHLTKHDTYKTIPMHETLYFMKVDGSFKLVNMISI